jgi:hypothetical protein
MRSRLAALVFLVGCGGSPIVFVDVTPPEPEGGSQLRAMAADDDDAGSAPDAGAPSPVDPPDAAGDDAQGSPDPAAPDAGPLATRDAGAPADAGSIVAQPPASGCVTVNGVMSCGDCLAIEDFNEDGSPQFRMTYQCGDAVVQAEVTNEKNGIDFCGAGTAADGGLAAPWSWCAAAGVAADNRLLTDLPCADQSYPTGCDATVILSYK